MNRRELLLRTVALVGTAGLVGCAERAPRAVRVDPQEVELVELPAPQLSGDVSLEAAIGRRRSVRRFTPEALSLAELGQLLWAAQGVTGAGGRRAAPSAGALYPIELHVLTDERRFHYLPAGHRAEARTGPAWRDELFRASGEQEAVRDAPAVVVVTAVPGRSAAKYAGRGRTFALLEAGHVTENLLLQATALGLGAVPVGGIDAAAAAAVLAADPVEEVVYLVPVGHPA